MVRNPFRRREVLNKMLGFTRRKGWMNVSDDIWGHAHMSWRRGEFNKSRNRHAKQKYVGRRLFRPSLLREEPHHWDILCVNEPPHFGRVRGKTSCREQVRNRGMQWGKCMSECLNVTKSNQNRLSSVWNQESTTSRQWALSQLGPNK